MVFKQVGYTSLLKILGLYLRQAFIQRVLLFKEYTIIDKACILISLTCMKLENPKPWIHTLLKHCAFVSANNFNGCDDYMPVHTRILHTDYKTINN